MKTLILSLVTLLGSMAMAAGYGEAGCGLGSVVMGKEGNQILASTTNSTSYTQIFGITSGTSNCVESGAVRSAQQVPLFIEINKMVLAKDASRGQGETLAGLAHLMGCDSAKLGQTLKSNYNQIFVETGMNPQGIQSQIEKQVTANKSQACGA